MSDLENELRAEREIISRATAGPWRWSKESDAPWGDCGPDLETEWLEDDGYPAIVGAAYGYDASGFTISDEDATFIAHARTALPLRSAQLEAVLAKCSELEATDNIVARAFATEFRRAIEEAGA